MIDRMGNYLNLRLMLNDRLRLKSVFGNDVIVDNDVPKVDVKIVVDIVDIIVGMKTVEDVDVDIVTEVFYTNQGQKYLFINAIDKKDALYTQLINDIYLRLNAFHKLELFSLVHA